MVPESSMSAIEKPHTRTPAVVSSASSLSERELQPKKRKLRTPETWKHFSLLQGDEDMQQSSQRLWYLAPPGGPHTLPGYHR